MTKSQIAGTAAMPNEHSTSTGRAPRRSTARPQKGAEMIRTVATPTPYSAATANPVRRLTSMCSEKKLADSATALFQAIRYLRKGQACGARAAVIRARQSGRSRARPRAGSCWRWSRYRLRAPAMHATADITWPAVQ